MKKLIMIFMLNVIIFSQEDKAIYVIDYVKIVNNNRAETIFYYENNWKYFRDEAMKKKYIHIYMLLELEDSTAGFDLMLVTIYKNKSQYDDVESNYKEIMAKREGETRMLNDIPKSDFRKIVFSTIGKHLFIATK